jgi:hypothetical protein
MPGGMPGYGPGMYMPMPMVPNYYMPMMMPPNP